MKRISLEKIYVGILLVIFAGIIVHTPLTVWLGSLAPDYTPLFKSWKEILMVFATIIAVILISRRKLWSEFSKDWLFRLIVAYAVLHIVTVVLLFQGSAQTAAGLAIDLRYVLYFGLIHVAVRLYPNYRDIFLKTALVGAAIIVGFATLQLFLPRDILTHIGYTEFTIQPYLTVDENPDYVRVNSTLRGPNPLGAYVVIVLGILTAALASLKINLRDKKVFVGTGILLGCSAIAVWISYSRSALLAAVVAVVVAVLCVLGRKIPRTIWLGCVAFCVVVVGALFVLRDTSFVSNVILHADPAEGNSKNSNEGHIASLNKGIDRMARQPFGGGVGSTGSATVYGDEKVPTVIENQYLYIAHETGWFGLLLFIALFVEVMRRLWKQRSNYLATGVFASGVGLALIGLLLPVWVDDTVSIVWWGLAGIVIAGEQYAKRQTK